MKRTFDTDSFSKRLKTKRLIDLNTGLREVSKKIGISPATLSRYENGELPEISNYIKICDWLGACVDEFIVPYRKLKSNK